MKNVFILFVFVLVANSLNAQVVNSSKSIIWNPDSSDPRLGFTFYSKGILAGVSEPAELIIKNLSAHKLSLKVTYTIYDLCGGSQDYSKFEVLNSGASSESSGAFFSGIDYVSDCKDVKKLSDNLKTKIGNASVYIKSVEDITAREEALKQQKEQEELNKQRKKEEELKQKRVEEEKKLEEEKKRLQEEEDKRKAAEEELIRKQESEAKDLRDNEEKLAKAKSIVDENDRKQAIEKVAQEKREIEKKAAEKKAIEKKDTRTVEEKQKELNETGERVRTAQALESQGDQLRNTDPSAALGKYQEAQSYAYSQRVEDKMKSLNSSFIAKGAVDAVMGISELSNQIDPKGNTSHSYVFSGYDGFSGNFDKLYSKYEQNPYNITFFGLRMSTLFLALELRIGYNNSPVYEFEVISNERGEGVILDNVGLQQQTLSSGLSGGLNFNIRNICIYGLYGAEYNTVVTKTELFSNGQYKLVGDNLHFPDFMFRLSTGIDFKIPKTSFGIGIRYTMNTINTKPETNVVEISNSSSTNSRYTYYINKIAKANYKYNDFGLRLIWDFQ